MPSDPLSVFYDRSIPLDDEQPCWNCKTPTVRIEVNYEARICGPECLAMIDGEADAAGVVWTGR